MTVASPDREVVWHDVECGAYAADLEIWLRLARESAGPVLELGAGTGRVSLTLARDGLRPIALDRREPLLGALRRRAAEAGVEVETVHGDARDLRIEATLGAVLAPMQFMHLLDEPERRRLMARASGWLGERGFFAAAVLGDRLALECAGASDVALIPDVREVDGWVFSSQPLETVQCDGALLVRRLRQLVSPGGELTEELDEIRLDALGAGELEAEAIAAGLRVRERIEIPATDEHVGSVVCVLEVGR